VNVLVFGFYGKLNVGDMLFCDAFKQLFPNINFIFTDIITEDNINNVSAIFIGGGSFLYADPNLSEECLNILKTKKIFYVGVGAETEIHPVHKVLIKLARLIAIRSPVGIEKIKMLNNNVIVIPDLVYSLPVEQKTKQSNSILILPNISVVPQNGNPHWQYNAWNHFKFEFSQFLDHLKESGFNINFFSMCNNKELNDTWAAYEIINSMKNRNEDYIIKTKHIDIKSISELFSKYDIILTQRFHGIILSELTRAPFISIFHHDKLKTSHFNEGIFISYYASSKQTFIDSFYSIKNIKLDKNICIKLDMFDELKNKINSLLSEA
jgi:polysaccharide pyruvyl transferase WcaK-like protein